MVAVVYIYLIYIYLSSHVRSVFLLDSPKLSWPWRMKNWRVNYMTPAVLRADQLSATPELQRSHWLLVQRLFGTGSFGQCFIIDRRQRICWWFLIPMVIPSLAMFFVLSGIYRVAIAWLRAAAKRLHEEYLTITTRDLTNKKTVSATEAT